MIPITELLEEAGFLKSLFDSIPCGVLVVDQDRRIQALNNVMEQTFGISLAESINKRGGDALGCINAGSNVKGCGFSQECQFCTIRNTTLDALEGKQINRTKAKVQFLIDHQPCDLQLLISSSPLDHDNNRLAIIILEDITELNNLRRRLGTEQSFAGIIGQNAIMKELFQTIKDVTDVNIPVLIQGESGTGKELVAAAIHNEGPRASKPFVPINCAALPEGVLESELFGHVKGAFTGAMRSKRGRFELADKGTLFLDEVGDMPKVLQAKLLRVLQEGRFERVGDEKSISVDVRIISATNCDLKREVEKNKFREDLFYRLNVVPLNIPPLRKRKDDIPLLAENLICKAQEEGQETEGISKEALAVIIDYPWPGNVRELQSALRFAIVKSRGGTISPDHLPAELNDWKKIQSSRGPSRKLTIDSVKDAMVQSGGNKAKAARLLGVGRATLYRFLTDFPDVS